MLFISRVYSSNEFWDADVQGITIELSPDYAQHLLDTRARLEPEFDQEGVMGLWSAEYWGHPVGVYFIEDFGESENIVDYISFDSDYPTLLPESVVLDPEAEECGMELRTKEIRHGGVVFKAAVKYTDTYLTTVEIPNEVLQLIAEDDRAGVEAWHNGALLPNAKLV